MKADILITNTLLLADPGKAVLLPDASIAIRDGLIIHCSPESPDMQATTVINGTGKLAMPGLINMHTHAPMTLFRGLADDLSLETWLHEHIFPAEARLVQPDMAYWCSCLAAAEMILSGTTCCADGYFLEDHVARAFCDVGLRSVAAQGIIDFPAPGIDDPARNIDEARAFLERWLEKNSLIRPALFVHSPYTCSNRTLRQAKQLARESGVLLFIHVAETRNEFSHIADARGASPIQHLDALDLLDQDTVCVHCVWTDRQDRTILAERGCTVVSCPRSNMKLASGLADLTAMVRLGIPVTLGTDSVASNNGLDLFSDMRLCAMTQKAGRLDPEAMPAVSVLRASTRTPARTLRFPRLSGTIEPGAVADLILIDLDRPHLVPFHSPDLLVYGAKGSDVDTVIVNGRLVCHGGKLLTMPLDEIAKRVTVLAEFSKDS